jgi:hypothetical protein
MGNDHRQRSLFGRGPPPSPLGARDIQASVAGPHGSAQDNDALNILATALLAFATLGSAAVATTAMEATCQDLAGQGFVCAEAVVDPNSGVDVDTVVYLAPTIPPVAALAIAEPTCQDLAGQGFVCAEATADPNSGVDVDTVVYLAPTIPPV